MRSGGCSTATTLASTKAGFWRHVPNDTDRAYGRTTCGSVNRFVGLAVYGCDASCWRTEFVGAGRVACSWSLLVAVETPAGAGRPLDVTAVAVVMLPMIVLP